ncbi:hypothetical protein F5Y06DRAFT_288785 [Hypoxylon sp. FL0890]|nr:hypothetical protein F5Y06DRAFT_288785 [Hypoxylon sp. FL0890]
MEASKHRPNNGSKRRIVVGIDFGTTFSAIAWAETEGELKRRIIDWSRSRISTGIVCPHKVPTQLRYSGDGHFEWGYQIPYDAQPQDILSLFKLGLEPDKFRSSIDSIGKALNFDNVDQKITDYLTGLLGHFRDVVVDQITSDTFQNTPMQFVLTVPAIWSDRAKQRTIEAFERVPNLPKDHSTTLLSEPEAAAIAALQEINHHDLKVNDSIIIVDAGGGTVDLITYTITSLHPVLEVVEAAEGTGDFCGSTRINDRFIQFLTSKLEGEEGWDDVVLYRAVEHFERDTKRRFNMDSLTQSEPFFIPVRGLNANNDLRVNRRGQFALRPEELHMFFEPDILKIIQLVREQIAMSDVRIRKILLVGGYGSSMYLRERLRIAVQRDSSMGNDIEILQPPNAWTSVVNGAVMKGLSLVKSQNCDVAIVKARAARKHYGYEFGVVFDREKHQSLRWAQYYDGRTGDWKVPAMEWIVKRGDLISENKPFQKNIIQSRLVSLGRPDKIIFSVFVDEMSDVPPLGRNGNVKVLCRVTANIDHISEDQLTKELGVDRQMYYDLKFQIESVCSLTPLSVCFN